MKKQEAELVKKHTERLFLEMNEIREGLTKRYMEDAKLKNLVSQQKKKENQIVKENFARQAHRERKQSKELNEMEAKQLREDLLRIRQEQAQSIRSQRKKWEDIQDLIEVKKSMLKYFPSKISLSNLFLIFRISIYRTRKKLE